MFVVWVDRQTDGQQMVSLPQCWEARVQGRQGRRAQSDGVPVGGVRQVALEKAGLCESTYRGMLCSWGVPGCRPRRASLSLLFWNQLKPLLPAAAFCPCASSRGLAVPTGSIPGCRSMALTWGRWPRTPAWGSPAGRPEAGQALSHPVPLPLPPRAPHHCSAPGGCSAIAGGDA